MSIKVHIVTPLSRGENFGRLLASIMDAKYPVGDNVDVTWWVMRDPNCSNPPSTMDIPEGVPFEIEIIHQRKSALAGHFHRNTVLDLLEKTDPQAYFYSLDDDNILHHLFLDELLKSSEKTAGFICSQLLKDGSMRLIAHPDNVRLNHIDTAQFAFKLKTVDGLRFDESRYDADGVFIEQLYNRGIWEFYVTPEAYCYYNYLRP